MAKKNDNTQVLDKLRTVQEIIADVMAGLEKPDEMKKPEKQLALEDVRPKLAEKSREGHTAEIRELLIKHGAEKLSEIDPKEYAELLAEVEAL